MMTSPGNSSRVNEVFSKIVDPQKGVLKDMIQKRPLAIM